MKKKIFSSLLLVAFAFAATSMFVSCKDYDDDINELRSLIDKNDSALRQALESQKTELNGYITTLQGQMRDAQADITTLKGQMTTAQSDISKLKEQMTTALAKISTLEEKMTAAEDAITAINNLLGGKLENGKTYKAAVEEIYGKVASLETDMAKVLEEEIPGLKDSIGLLRAVDADLQLQINTLKNFKTKMEEEVIPGLQLRDTQLSDSIKDIISQLGVIRKAVSDNATAIGDINKMIGGELENGQTYKEFVEQLRKDLNKANDDIEDLQEGLSQLNVLIKTSLRSLVFKPDCYYEGIEACKLLTLTYNSYDLPATAWNIKEKVGYDASERYPFKKEGAFKVLSFVAQYYMNPSSADLSNADVKVIDEDKEYIIDRASEAGLTVKNWTPKDGILNVNLQVSDNSKIKRIGGGTENEPNLNPMVTVFATQVNLTKAGEDTTITSDWAAVVAKNVSDIKIAHTKTGALLDAEAKVYSFTGVTNPNEDPQCTIKDMAGMHLMPSVFDAAFNDNKPQDVCYWDGDLDLRQLVEVHYTTLENQHGLMTADELKNNGLEFKFELTSLKYGANNTDESAHAAIQGTTFRPQPASENGEQQAYNAKQVRASEVGRTPLVRVSLIDKESGDVLDYGYIRIEIVEKETVDPEQPDKFISYTGKGYNYNGECELEPWSFQTTWSQTEYDLYHMLDITRTDFEENYGTAPVMGQKGAQQYVMVKKISDTEATFVEVEKADPVQKEIGTIVTINETSTEDGTLTSTLKWNIDQNAAYDLFVTNNKAPYTRAIKYESKNKKKYPDVYVVFTTGTSTITSPTFTMAVNDASGIDNYWYTPKAEEGYEDTGFVEIHTNTLTPEDNAGGTAEKLDATFSNVFKGNLTDYTKLITVANDNTAKGEWAADKLKYSFFFADENNGAEFKGLSGKTYVLQVKRATDPYTLLAYDKADKSKKTEAIAKLTGKDKIGPQNKFIDATTEMIEYQKDSEYAKDMLNYVAAQKINPHTIIAKIGALAFNACNKFHTVMGTFDVRFLRPLNVYSGDKTIEDASVQGLQEIKLADLVEFNDWRLAWNGKENSRGKDGAYYTYYGIKGITIDGVNDGQVISTNEEILANLGQDAETFVSLKSVSNQLDFTYSTADGGKLVYKNLSNTLTEFTLQIPVMVEYIWGKVPAIAQVKVIRTHANAKKN